MIDIPEWLQEAYDNVELCVYCGSWADTREHVIPQSLGGKYFKTVPACKWCNCTLRNVFLFTIEDRARYLLPIALKSFPQDKDRLDWLTSICDGADIHIVKKEPKRTYTPQACSGFHDKPCPKQAQPPTWAFEPGWIVKRGTFEWRCMRCSSWHKKPEEQSENCMADGYPARMPKPKKLNRPIQHILRDEECARLRKLKAISKEVSTHSSNERNIKCEGGNNAAL